MEESVRGITFEIPNEHGNWLYKILQPLDCTKYSWRIGYGEGYKSVNGDLIALFPAYVDRLDGGALLEFIDTKESQYIIHADLKAYPLSAEVLELQTYDDYLVSSCEFVLLIVDCIYITIYCKDAELLDQLAANAEALHVSSLCYATDGNDHRTRLRVW